VIVPELLLRKLYKRGSLRETGDGRFAFTLRNPLRVATIVAPPQINVNGIAYGARDVVLDHIDLAAISARTPLVFRKGDEVTLGFRGRLMRGGNRIHILAETREFGAIEIDVDDREAEFCELPRPPETSGTV
jgi:hypothetical protein